MKPNWMSYVAFALVMLIAVTIASLQEACSGDQDAISNDPTIRV